MAKKRRRGATSKLLGKKRFPPEAPCACHSGQPYRRCCQALHDGARPADASALMRSRYAAYALGRAEYVVATTAAESPHRKADRDVWLRDLALFSKTTRFVGLELLGAGDGPGGGECWVEFRAGLEQNDEDASFVERSRFVREPDGFWRYVDALERVG